VSATSVQIVLDADGSGAGAATPVTIVTLEGLTPGFDASTLLNTLLSNGELK
jgi:hypothetical protein